MCQHVHKDALTERSGPAVNHLTSSDAAAATCTSDGSLMCAPVMNADGNVIAVCLLTSAADSAFTDDDEKVKTAKGQNPPLQHCCQQ